MMDRSRFCGWPTTAARSVLALLLILVAYGMSARTDALPEANLASHGGDAALYRAIATRVGEGEAYYPVVVSEQRARNYPLKPFVTVRMPTLALFIGQLSEARAHLLLVLLMIGSSLAAALRLRSTLSGYLWLLPSLVIAVSAATLAAPGLTLWHESWAGLLMLLAVSCRSRRHWAFSVAVGLAAALTRELALPFLAAMAVLAWREQCKGEAAAWIGTLALAGAALAAHAWVLSQYVGAGDPASDGWAAAGGWSFILMMVQKCGIFALSPLPIVALVVPLALIGWTGLVTPFGERCALILTGYITAFLIVGRPDNFYWGLLLTPLLFAGLAFAPFAIGDLVKAARPRRDRAAPA